MFLELADQQTLVKTLQSKDQTLEARLEEADRNIVKLHDQVQATEKKKVLELAVSAYPVFLLCVCFYSLAVWTHL